MPEGKITLRHMSQTHEGTQICFRLPKEQTKQSIIFSINKLHYPASVFLVVKEIVLPVVRLITEHA